MVMRRLLFFIVITAMGMFKGHSQTLVQTYTDRCTGATQVFTVPMNGTTVVAFYNRSKTFTSQDFQDGTLQAWLEETYLWWTSLSPCSTTTTGATATQQTTQQTTQQATQAATNATANVPPPPTTNTTTNAPPTASSPPPADTTSTPPPADTNATSNNTSSPDTSTGGTDNANTGTNNSGTDSNQGSSSETQSGSDQTDTSSTETTESTEQTTESTGTEDTSTEESSTETSSEETSESSTEETTESEEVETEETTEESKEESTEESTEEESENQESDEESTEEESDESSEEESEEETDEEESESDEDEEDNEDDAEEESDDEGEEEGDKKKKKKRALAPPVVMANMLSQQGPDGRYTQAAMFGVSQSSLLGTETYGINAMVYSNLQQFMLTANYSKVHIKVPNVSEIDHSTHKHYGEDGDVCTESPTTPPQPRVNRVYSGSLGIMKMFTTYVTMMNHSMVWIGEKGSVKGLAFSTSLTSVEVDIRKGLLFYDTQILGSSLTGFYTKPFKFDRLTVSPMVAVSNPLISYDLFYHSAIWSKDVMVIGGSSFTYSLTQRFGLNLGINVIESTIKDFPTLKTFTIGGRLSF